jgi:hypothetical protein
MTQVDDLRELNALRRLRDAFPADARLDDRRRAEALRFVLAAARARRPDAGFPETAFVWLAAGIVVLAVWLVVRVIGVLHSTEHIALCAVAGVVAANLVSLPLAAVLIVRRART